MYRLKVTVFGKSTWTGKMTRERAIADYDTLSTVFDVRIYACSGRLLLKCDPAMMR